MDSTDPLGLVTWALGTLVTIGVLIGAGVRYGLMPYLREHLIEPMHEVKKQVSENHHSNEPPTVLDRIDDVQQDVRTLSRVLDGHINAGAEWVRLIEKEIELLRREAGLKARDD